MLGRARLNVTPSVRCHGVRVRPPTQAAMARSGAVESKSSGSGYCFSILVEVAFDMRTCAVPGATPTTWVVTSTPANLARGGIGTRSK